MTNFLRRSVQCNESFMIKHFQRNKRNDISIDITSFDQRRFVFISLIALYQTWAKCPSSILYCALFILPFKRKWIYFPKKYRSEIQSNRICQMTLFSETEEFVTLLKWKDDQGLVVWALDEHKYPDNDPSVNELIHPFWYYLNAKLSNLYDAVSRNKYNPLILDTKWWKNKAIWKGKYNVKTASILAELYFCTLKFKSLQEIIYQSNPESLVVIKSFTNNIHQELRANLSLYDDIDDACKEDWVFTDCYDPYDICN